MTLSLYEDGEEVDVFSGQHGEYIHCYPFTPFGIWGLSADYSMLP